MIVLSEIIKSKDNSDWKETQGIKWRLIKANNNSTLQIQIICPRCKNVGYLVRANSRNRVGYRILHGGGTGCQFGWTQPEFDALDAIYRIVRGRRF